MARVYTLDPKARRIERSSYWMRNRMRKMKKSQKHMGALLGIAQASFGYKLERMCFSYIELVIVMKELEMTKEEILSMMEPE
ncbi:MAG: hypothetical protein E7300_00850 [Lachnospiraceae bacterium]|nr:hypothetical protein [Lachnospiraceae bacterium]